MRNNYQLHCKWEFSSSNFATSEKQYQIVYLSMLWAPAILNLRVQPDTGWLDAEAADVLHQDHLWIIGSKVIGLQSCLPLPLALSGLLFSQLLFELFALGVGEVLHKENTWHSLQAFDCLTVVLKISTNFQQGDNIYKLSQPTLQYMYFAWPSHFLFYCYHFLFSHILT